MRLKRRRWQLLWWRRAYPNGAYEIAVGLSGDLEEAEQLFRIAEWWAGNSHAKAVAAYDRAVLYVSSRDDENGKKKLREAISLSPRAISRYFRLNEYFAEASGRDPEFNAIVSQAKTGSR